MSRMHFFKEILKKYMRQPPGYESKSNSGLVCKLDKAIWY
jgi:hypothetical protein